MVASETDNPLTITNLAVMLCNGYYCWQASSRALK
jgi:hypothetical protein